MNDEQRMDQQLRDFYLDDEVRAHDRGARMCSKAGASFRYGQIRTKRCGDSPSHLELGLVVPREQNGHEGLAQSLAQKLLHEVEESRVRYQLLLARRQLPSEKCKRVVGPMRISAFHQLLNVRIR